MTIVTVKRPTFPIVLTLCLGISLSTLATLAAARWERANYRLQFQRQTDSLATALQRSINRYTDILLALGDFYRVTDSTVSRTEFNQFVERVLNEYPGIQALEWAPVILAEDRPAFEATLQSTGFPDFRITERESRGGLVRASIRAHYIPVTYLQPWEGNQRAFGYDLTSDTTRRMALETARDTAKVAASGRIRLVQENKNKFGFLVFLPLYQSPSPPSTVVARRQQVTGYLLGVFRVADVVEESVQTLSYDIDFTLTDQTATPSDQLLGTYHAATQTVTTDGPSISNRNDAMCPTIDDCRHSLTTGGRQWGITFTPAANYPSPKRWSALSTLVIGLLLTTMVARYLAQTQAELTRTRELSDLKIQLFSMASHEFRTPLSTILLSAQTLESSALSMNHRHRIYGRIRAAGKRMNLLLSDLLTLARAESGKLQFSPEILNLEHFCQQLIEEVKFSFEIPFLLTFTPCTHDQTAYDQTAYLDPQLLRSILNNLLTNAVKYSSPDPEITLTLTCQPHAFIFEVQDNGIGILETDQNRLYETFYRGDNVGDIAGTGLGLSVVQACLQLHQGTLTYQSQIGKGTTFKVTLPRID